MCGRPFLWSDISDLHCFFLSIKNFFYSGDTNHPVFPQTCTEPGYNRQSTSTKKRMMMKNSRKRSFRMNILAMFSIMLAVMLAGGCDNSTSPNQDLSDQRLAASKTAPAHVEQDPSNEPIYMAEGFAFLPPMVNDAEFSVTFDAGLSPVVEICETTACDQLHASFDMNGDGSERVRIDEEDEHYIVNWHLRQTGAEAGQTYRVRVLVNDLVLGHADVHVVRNGREANEHRSAGEIAVVANQTLPVKFFVAEQDWDETDHFVCGDEITDVDGNSYATVQIGEQCWMAENLNLTKDSDGNTITRHCYNESEDNCDIYGGLYDWNTVMNGAGSSHSNPSGVQGICPAGWHVPSNEEWKELELYLGMSEWELDDLEPSRGVASNTGGQIKISGTDFWQSPNSGATNESGFSALPGGEFNDSFFYNFRGLAGFWWSSSEAHENRAWLRIVTFDSEGMLIMYRHISYGHSLRCLLG